MSQDAAVRAVAGRDVVAFLVEVGAFVLLGNWAWRAASAGIALQLLALVVVLGVAALLWGLFAAPKATFGRPVLAIAVKVLVLGGSVVAAYTMLPLLLASCWAVLVVVSTALVSVVRLT